MTSHKKWLQILEAFHLASAQIITFDPFWTIHLFLRSAIEIFIFQYWELAFDFLSTIQFNLKMSFSIFLSQILVSAMAFAAHNLFFISRFTFGELYCKNIKIKMGRYIGTSLYKYQDHYWPIIHDKLKDLFTTITHSFQDFSHKDICAYITS